MRQVINLDLTPMSTLGQLFNRKRDYIFQKAFVGCLLNNSVDFTALHEAVWREQHIASSIVIRGRTGQDTNCLQSFGPRRDPSLFPTEHKDNPSHK